MSGMGRGTLSRQLILRTTGLVALVAIVLTMLTSVAAQRILLQQLDTQLQTQVGKFSPRDADDRRTLPGPEGGGPGQQIGLLIYDGRLDAAIVLTGDSAPLVASEEVEAVLEQITPTGRPVTVNLPGLGQYRLVASVDRNSTFRVTGLPLSTVWHTMINLLLVALVLTLLAITASFFAVRQVVERSLRPLQRLATTANTVSSLELDSGEVAVPVRVDEADTDPRSEVGRVGLAFNHMLDNVEGALAARQQSETKVRQFVADASHELRNPLASIRGYAELTRRERDTMSPTMAHAMSRIESESTRMSSLVEDLLLLARLDSRPELEMGSVDLSSLAVGALSDARAAGPDHTWRLDLPDTPVTVRGDRNRLQQVLVNLLANARVHTPTGTSVTLALRTDGKDAVVTVTDNGPGIPAEVRDHVFERFTRADAARARSGPTGQSTGLGLAIVAAIVATHGGSVTLSDAPSDAPTGGGPGAMFTVRLPLAES